MPCQILQLKSLYFLLYGSTPGINHLKIFDCVCFYLLKLYNTHKLQPKISTCIFLGYADQYKWYICFSLQTNWFFMTWHVIFDEAVFPYTSVSLVSISYSLSPPSISLHNIVLPIFSSSLSTFRATTSLHTLPLSSTSNIVYLGSSPFSWASKK